MIISDACDVALDQKDRGQELIILTAIKKGSCLAPFLVLSKLKIKLLRHPNCV